MTPGDSPAQAGQSPERRPGEAAATRYGPVVLRLSGILLWSYLCLVLFYGEVIAGVAFSARRTALLFLIGATVLLLAPGWSSVRKSLSPARMFDVGLATASLLVAMLVCDVAYSMYRNAQKVHAFASIADEVRLTDPHVWHGELIPRSYFPSRKSFTVFKPNVRVTADTYGEFYSPGMLASRTMADSVLELRHLSYFIGPHGVRELEPLDKSRIFALGDSYVFGYATDEGRTWPDVLGAALGQPVYNLGIPSTGPRPQLELLRYMLQTNGDSIHVKQVLWMMCESNDLENRYEVDRILPPAPKVGVRTLLEGTALQAVVSVAGRVKDESIVRRFLDGDLTFRDRGSATGNEGLYQIDGVSLPMPLYHSKRWGYRIFNPDDVARSTKPREYVLNHPHRAQLDQTYREMRELSQRYGFEIIVVIAPSDARLYGRDFDGFPKVTDEPYFVDYLAELAGKNGFKVINLLPLLQPYAQKELLFYRDDHHFNLRGNQVVAELIRQAIAPR